MFGSESIDSTKKTIFLPEASERLWRLCNNTIKKHRLYEQEFVYMTLPFLQVGKIYLESIIGVSALVRNFPVHGVVRDVNFSRKMSGASFIEGDQLFITT